jgi:hypothetical protein
LSERIVIDGGDFSSAGKSLNLIDGAQHNAVKIRG